MFDTLYAVFSGYNANNVHRYSFAATGLRMKSKEFDSRDEAKEQMYKVLSKNHLTILKIYDDKHDKTYVCNNGVKFYINRMY